LETTDGSGGRAERAARRIAGVYALAAGAWILLSDAVLALVTSAEADVTLAGAAKGLAFVAVTALLLHALVRRAVRHEQVAQGRLQDIIDGTPAAIYVKDARDLRLLLVNRECARLLGVTPEEAVGRLDADLIGEAAARINANDHAVLERGEPIAVEEVLQVEGEPRSFISAKFPLRDADGRITAVCGISTDISPLKRAEAERERLETELAQTQRLEGLGRLAGGVAHDFNNLLLVILSYADLLDRELGGDRDEVTQIRVAAERAAALTQQLLVFGRRELVRNRRLDLNRLVAGAEQLLRRTLGEDVDLRVHAAADLPPVYGDQGRLEQVLLNLVVNARDALPFGGEVEIATGALDVPGGASMAPGRYVLLTVRDDGTGMAPEVVERAIEPFFTTKPAGRAIGLGLATVYGIVRDARGHLEISSVPGRGTKVMVYLPVAEGEPETEPDDDGAFDGAGERVLVVEDAEPVRLLVVRLLEDAGYRTIAAAGGAEALERDELAAGEVDLLLTDVVMPGMSGRELADRVHERQPDLPVLYMSGYAGDVLRRHGVMTTGTGYVEKPFEARTLLLAVRRALDQARTP
jgi:two-component system cell cycle sensor histidine kinase/response regulator CckA